MSLYVIATPIGHPDDITLRAIETLRSSEIVIGEERKEVSKLLKRLDITGKRLELLNEHSREADFKELVELCKAHQVALVSDCGTPGFCDPGADLVATCRQQGIAVVPVPGTSSLMTLLSVCGVKLQKFQFWGFLPADREQRETELRRLGSVREAVVLMDTPYRLERLVSELAQRFPDKQAILGLNLTQEQEDVQKARLRDLLPKVTGKKAEFVLILLP